MHKPGSFLVLMLVTVVVVLAAVFVQREPTRTVMEEKHLFPGLAEQLNKAAHVRIGKGESAIGLRRQKEDSWGVPDRNGHPADVAKVHELLLGVAGLERLEQKTGNPKRYGQLGFGNEDVMRIVIESEDGQSLADFLLGKRGAAKGRRARDEMYVRVQGDPTVWLVEGNLPHGSGITDWLQRDILILEQTRIRDVRIIHPDGEEVIIKRGDRKTTDYRLVNLPSGAEPKSAYAINSIASNMAKLRLQDVRSIRELDLSNGEPGAKILLTTFDGLRVTIETRQVGEDVFARLDAGFDAALVQPEPEGDQSQGKESPPGKEDVAEMTDAEKDQGIASAGNGAPKSEQPDARSVEEEAAALSKQWRDWAYILPEYRLGNLTKRISDLIKEPAGESDAAVDDRKVGKPDR
uniref:DUF4340 domain-containing protein n=1 Tax=Candidatus Kentrum sp. FW TaxID=2126338 RepID=A0A450SFM1_9GAMM|nr:MAG: protein of unknown function (DUF4340) [Candidatus Kentron sp. FW]VFJ51668.1 MAG: protein of unknown function (DUF4340) [Candidatus Kentron sp. FW]